MSIKFLNTGKGSSGSNETKLNAFCQETEPTIKDGIWVKNVNSYKKLITTDFLVSEPLWGNVFLNSSNVYVYSVPIVVGDYIYFTSSDLLYKVHIKTGSLTEVATLPTTGSYNLVANIGNELYIWIGGIKLHKYNLDTNTFTELTAFPSTSYYTTQGGCMAWGTNIYIFTGYTSGRTYRYDTLTDTYTQINNMPEWASYPIIAKIGDYIYIIGGVNYENTTKVFKFDPNTETFERKSDCPAIMFEASGGAIGDSIYIFSGYAKSASANAKYAYKYNTITNTWTKLADIHRSYYGYINYGVSVGKESLYLFKFNPYNTNTVDITEYKVPFVKFEGDSIVLLNGSTYKTQLIGSKPENVVGNIGTTFQSIHLTDEEGAILDNVATYYGDGSEWIQLSESFSCQEIEYIESSGTQYINTGVKVKNNLQFEIKFNMLAENTSYNVILGGRTSPHVEDCSYFHKHTGSINAKTYITSTENVLTTASTYTNVVTTLTLTKDSDSTSGVLTLTDGTNTDTLTITDISTSTSYPLYLFACNATDVGEGVAVDLTTMRLYYCKLWNDGVLVRDFVPAQREDGAVGLLDKLTNRFYGNAGTGEFIAGPEVS